jgi:hypothetical protein
MSESNETGAEGPAGLETAVAPPGHRRWRRSFLWMAVEMILISVSVFLGLIGQQWLETAQRREQTMSALQRFRAEIVTNRREVAAKFAYHAPLQKNVRTFLRADAEARKTLSFKFEGIQPLFFERTAWELAVATQSLTYMDAELGYWLSRIYTFQGLVDGLTRAFTESMFVNPPSYESEAFLRAVDLYYGDLVGMEPGLLQMYDTVLPMIDAAAAE